MGWNKRVKNIWILIIYQVIVIEIKLKLKNKSDAAPQRMLAKKDTLAYYYDI